MYQLRKVLSGRENHWLLAFPACKLTWRLAGDRNFNVDVVASQSDMLDVAMSNSVKFNGHCNRLTPEGHMHLVN